MRDHADNLRHLAVIVREMDPLPDRVNSLRMKVLGWACAAVMSAAALALIGFSR